MAALKTHLLLDCFADDDNDLYLLVAEETDEFLAELIAGVMVIEMLLRILLFLILIFEERVWNGVNYDRSEQN